MEYDGGRWLGGKGGPDCWHGIIKLFYNYKLTIFTRKCFALGEANREFSAYQFFFVLLLLLFDFLRSSQYFLCTKKYFQCFRGSRSNCCATSCTRVRRANQNLNILRVFPSAWKSKMFFMSPNAFLKERRKDFYNFFQWFFFWFSYKKCFFSYQFRGGLGVGWRRVERDDEFEVAGKASRVEQSAEGGKASEAKTILHSRGRQEIFTSLGTFHHFPTAFPHLSFSLTHFLLSFNPVTSSPRSFVCHSFTGEFSFINF